MRHYLLFYKVAADYAERREALRTDHLDHAREARDRGELLLGGAFADPVAGAALLFHGTSPAVAETFANADPYVTSGLVTRWHVREWTTVVGTLMADLPPDDAVVRMWRGTTARGADADAYLDHLTGSVMPDLADIPGYRGAEVLRRTTDSSEEFIVTTRWASMEAVRDFCRSRRGTRGSGAPGSRRATGVRGSRASLPRRADGRSCDLIAVASLRRNWELVSDRAAQYGRHRPGACPPLSRR
jgi:uncharacterized protein YciI/heme-degrading monooxygenase HmoA